MIYKVIITCPNDTSVSYEFTIENDGDLERAVKEAIDTWRKENGGRSLFEEGCSVKIEKV